ncbi:MAG TPA: hypothetical protein VJT31_06810, partial [Rugosimonospora sp.]|nr:hypothetical protein [Rugosimonospora sp.]
MKRPSPTSRRLLTLAATAALGVLAALAISSPASAHPATVAGSPGGCQPQSGNWKVAWTVTNDWGTDAQITAIQASFGSTVTNLDIGTMVRANGGSVSGVQLVDGSRHGPSSVTLTVSFVWPRDNWRTTITSDPVSLDRGKCVCASPSPTVKPSPSPQRSSPAATPPASATPTPVAPPSPSAGGGSGG